MSPVIVFAPFLAFVVSLCIWGMFRVVGRWNRNSRQAPTGGRAAAILAFPLLTALFFVWLPRGGTFTGTGVTAQIANDRLLSFSVPEAATDVDFRRAYFSGLVDQADFLIEETPFLEWMNEQQWMPAEFHTDEDGIHWKGKDNSEMHEHIWVSPVVSALDSRNEDLEVRNGYYFYDDGSQLKDDCGLSVVYDKDRGRAYVWYTAF